VQKNGYVEGSGSIATLSLFDVVKERNKSRTSYTEGEGARCMAEWQLRTQSTKPKATVGCEFVCSPSTPERPQRRKSQGSWDLAWPLSSAESSARETNDRGRLPIPIRTPLSRRFEKRTSEKRVRGESS